MPASKVFEHPVLKELKTLVFYFPSLNEPDFKKCCGQKKLQARQCLKDVKQDKRLQAEKLWDSFKDIKELPNDDEFYSDVQHFLSLIHCSSHHRGVQTRFNDWKQLRVANNLEQTRIIDFSYASSEASLPGTPEQSSIFDSPIERDVTPFSSPLTECDTPRTPCKSPSSDTYYFIEDTPSKIIYRSPVSIETEEEPAIAEINTKDVSILTINPTSTAFDEPSNTEKCDVVERITERCAISSQESSNKTPIVAVKEVVEQASTVIVEDTIAQKKSPFLSRGPIKQQGAYVAGIGYGFPKRKGSLRDDSSVVREFYKYLTPSQLEEGRVYVLQHNEHDDIFKIGFTKSTASQRSSQPGNCYSENTRAIYQSDAPFVGAMKAERLAQASLHDRNMYITKCDKCGHGHREWFRSTKETILETVKLMEGFIRLPAYELQDGKMKLSAVANEMVKTMCNFSTKKLGIIMASYQESNMIEYDSEKPIGTKLMSTTQTTVCEVTAEAPDQSVEVKEPSTQLSVPPSTDSKESSPSMGTKVGRVFKGARKSFGHIKDKIQPGRSRESTPESDNAQDNSQDEPDIWQKAEELMAGFFWSIVPENSKPENCFENGEKPREFHSLVGAVERTTAKFKEDFARAAKAEDDAASGL
ncbi:hypothetical protein NW762_004960 [Fusarium torreyae]|uniref:Bacteriophage T5 Orf172 DNA-binding domain-containing protein n=1 Tax=Fusarium torreyae TaxID=1237075 RepID=A0A9W8S6S7_9HYPO|nr:hypothetical protein NW762_004960 [Fusarium torreyae]